MKPSTLHRFAPAVLCFALLTAACGSDTKDSTATDTVAAAPDTTRAAAPAEAVHVVASTTWTGALAKLAGASDIEVIAPTTILHPPDYDPKPSDLAAAADADLVVYAEFESFATRLVEAAGSDAVKFPLTLENTPATIEAEVLRLAAQLGTEDVARANLDEFLVTVTELGTDASETAGTTVPVVVSQVFMSYWADWAGLASAGTFGPASIGAADLASLLALTPTLVFDNFHLPGGQALEAEGIPRIELINYPGDDLDLVAVFQHNHDLIVSARTGKITADPDVSVPAASAHGDSAHGDTSHGDTSHGDTTDTTAPAHGDHSHTETTDASGHGG